MKATHVRRVARGGAHDVVQRDVGAQHARVVAGGEQQVAGHVEADHVALALGCEQQHAAAAAPAPAVRRAARCSASTRSVISDARCSSATVISPVAHLSPTMNSAGVISSTSISARRQPVVHRRADGAFGRLGVAREQRAGEVLRSRSDGDPTTVQFYSVQKAVDSANG